MPCSSVNNLCILFVHKREPIFYIFAAVFILVYIYITLPLQISSDTNNSTPGKVSRGGLDYQYIPILSASYSVNTSTCKIPDLDPWHESINLLSEKCDDEDEQEPRCKEREARDWFYTKDSKLIVNLTALHNDGYSWKTLRCCYRAIERVQQSLENYDMNADYRVRLSKKCHRIRDQSYHIPHEFVKVFCMTTSFPLFEDVVYRDYFVFARLDKHAQEKVSRWKDISPSDRPPSILMLGMDTNSRLNSRRTLHKTLQVLRNIGAVEMMGYTKVGENTFPNTVPFFTGISVDQMKEYCFHTNAQSQDDCPYIWKDLDRAGYLTATLEDSPFGTGFNHMKTGFVLKPTNFYWRPFALFTNLQSSDTPGYVKCLGHRRYDQVHLEYLADIIKRASNGTPVFVHNWLSIFCHDCITHASFWDEPLANFIWENIESSQNTVVFLISDHGDRYGSFRETTLGWYEDKLPTLWVYLSPDLRERFPEWDSAIKINAGRLSSHFDIYHTMIQIMATFNKNLTFNESYESLNKTAPQRTGQSLLVPIPENRTCRDAGIPSVYCACAEPEILDMKSLNSSMMETLNKVATASVTYLRGYLPPICATPVVKEIVAGKYMREIVGDDAGGKHYSEIYVLSLFTDPGNFLFEVTVKKRTGGEREFVVENWSDILRMNKIRRSVSCVHDPDLHRYCYCLP